jgi:hypothetical protein
MQDWNNIFQQLPHNARLEEKYIFNNVYLRRRISITPPAIAA